MQPCGTKSHPNAETILFTISKGDKELNESSSHVHCKFSVKFSVHCKFSVTAGMKSSKLMHAKYTSPGHLETQNDAEDPGEGLILEESHCHGVFLHMGHVAMQPIHQA